MGKFLCVLLGLCLMCMLAAGCSGKTEDENSGPARSAGFIDLSAMSDTLRIAELTNITSTPANYLGKTIKLGGVYQAQYYEPTQQYYHCILIIDAAACCQQGLEFVWNGNHRYPDDYPKDGTPIELSGVYESHQELGKTYYHLVVDEITFDF